MTCYSLSSDPNCDIESLEIPVNAVATLLKSFFSELSEALIPSSLCDELLEAAGESCYHFEVFYQVVNVSKLTFEIEPQIVI